MIYHGLRVVDASRGIAGGYCSKLLTDLGADAVKLEPPDGHPLRRYSATDSVGKDGDPVPQHHGRHDQPERDHQANSTGPPVDVEQDPGASWRVHRASPYR